MYSQMVGCSSNSTLWLKMFTLPWAVVQPAVHLWEWTWWPEPNTEQQVQVIIFLHIGFFAVLRGLMCVHVKLDYCLKFVHPSVMVPVSWKLTEDVNWLLYLQRRGCWSSFGMQHALGGETFSHFRRICWQYLIRLPSAIVTVIHCQIRYPKQKTQNLFHFNRIHLKRGWWSNPSVDKRND